MRNSPFNKIVDRIESILVGGRTLSTQQISGRISGEYTPEGIRQALYRLEQDGTVERVGKSHPIIWRRKEVK